jgi:3-deoxy-7-phosphoheptulonate synthase
MKTPAKTNTQNLLSLADARDRKEVSEYQSDRQIVPVGHGVAFGGKQFHVIAGPCSVESEEQFLKIAKCVSECGAVILRGGIFKPRTSPYSFQGLGREGLNILRATRGKLGVPLSTEILDVRQLDDLIDCVDLFQVGSRNMYNYPLLKELGSIQKPVLLKRGFMATVDEFRGAAEYILSRGNPNVILCERGIRSFDTSTRFTLDLNVIPVLKEKLKCPIVVDPSHGTGVARYVEALSLAAAAVGADGLMIEVHPEPLKALSDGPQSLTFTQFEQLMKKLRLVVAAVGREIKAEDYAGAIS